MNKVTLWRDPSNRLGIMIRGRITWVDGPAEEGAAMLRRLWRGCPALLAQFGMQEFTLS